MLTHISTFVHHNTCPHHRNIWCYTCTSQHTTQMTSLVAHADTTTCTDGTTLLMSWTHFGTQIMMMMSRYRWQMSLQTNPQSQNTPKLIKYPVNYFITTLEWHRFLEYIIPECNMMYFSQIGMSTCYKGKKIQSFHWDTLRKETTLSIQ